MHKVNRSDLNWLAYRINNQFLRTLKCFWVSILVVNETGGFPNKYWTSVILTIKKLQVVLLRFRNRDIS
jgi:hypothetical protein